MAPWSHQAIRFEAATKAASRASSKSVPDEKQAAEEERVVKNMLEWRRAQVSKVTACHHSSTA
jgi:hypothetical protein